ncbi:hypothetical protein EV643_103283 [Kribbella sp. VKM Ac-2527]|uniref:Uncharacterized protein n=1 Tax=Kribbella caucasensis TaxID=2512215 RepID=A0A4R6KJQ5_9ACTN|nr:hypothetical protein EV643_103283 [Kribbella sp. VKM Ac-2527]
MCFVHHNDVEQIARWKVSLVVHGADRIRQCNDYIGLSQVLPMQFPSSHLDDLRPRATFAVECIDPSKDVFTFERCCQLFAQLLARHDDQHATGTQQVRHGSRNRALTASRRNCNKGRLTVMNRPVRQQSTERT